MLDMKLIDSTIEELEASDTNFTNCERLASLYIIKDYHSRDDDFFSEMSRDNDLDVQKELSDILPHYEMYCDRKREYQMNMVGKDAVLKSLHHVCNEISEFIHTLYSSTDMEDERNVIIDMVSNLHFEKEEPLEI